MKGRFLFFLFARLLMLKCGHVDRIKGSPRSLVVVKGIVTMTRTFSLSSLSGHLILGALRRGQWPYILECHYYLRLEISGLTYIHFRPWEYLLAKALLVASKVTTASDIKFDLRMEIGEFDYVL